MKQGKNYEQWKEQNDKDKGKVELTVNFEMGLQKKTSGTKYDSPSGLEFMIGARTKAIIQCIVSSKMSYACLKANDVNTDTKTFLSQP